MADILGFTSGALIPTDGTAIDPFAEEETLEELGPLSLTEAPNSDIFQSFDNAPQASTLDPNVVGSDRDLARALGILPETVTPETRSIFKQQRTEAEITEGTLDAPITRNLLDLDNELMNLSTNDIPNLVSSERVSKDLSFFGAFGNGIDLLQGLGWRFVEASAEATGFEGLEAFAQASAEEEMAEAAANGVKQRFLGIQDAGDFFTWMKQTAGEQLPMMAPSMVGGVAGFAVAGPVGAALGAFIPSFILGVGETQNAVKERDTSVEAPGIVFGSGALIGLLDSALPFKLGSTLRGLFGREVTEAGMQRLATKLIAKRVAVAGGKGMLIEGITESMQEAISEMAAASATDQEIDVDVLVDQMIEAFAAGAFMGGGVTSTVEVIRARKIKKALKRMDELKRSSELNTLAPDKSAELRTAQLRGSGVETVFVPFDKLMDYAQSTGNAVEALEALNIENLDEARESGATKVAISLENFTSEILGTDGLTALENYITVHQDSKSLAEATEEAFVDEDAESNFREELEAYDTTVELKEKVEKVITKVAKEPRKAVEIIEEAGIEVEKVLDALVVGAAERKFDTSVEEISGRLAKLDDDIAVQDRAVLDISDEIEALEEAGKGTKNAEARLTKAIAARNATLDEQLEMAVGAQKAGLIEEFEQDIVPGEGRTPDLSEIGVVQEGVATAPKNKTEARAKKEIITKAETLQKLRVKITKESIRATRQAFKAGLRAGKNINKAKNEFKAQIKGLTMLTKNSRSILRSMVNRAESLKQLETVAGKLPSKVADLMTKERIVQIKEAIKSKLNAAKNKPKIQSGKKEGKDPDFEIIMASLREAFNQPVGQAKAELESILSVDPLDRNNKDTANPLRITLVAFKAGNKNVTVETAEQALLALDRIIADGNFLAAERLMAKRKKVSNAVKESVEEVEEDTFQDTTIFKVRLKKSWNDVRGHIASMHDGWDELLDKTIGANVKLYESLRMTRVVQDYKGLVMQWNSKFIDLAKTSFNLTTDRQVLNRQFDDGKQINLGKFVNARAQRATEAYKEGTINANERDKEIKRSEVELVYSKAEIRKLWMERQDPSIASAVTDGSGNAFTEEILGAMDSYMLPEDKAFALGQLKLYREMYTEINKTYRKIYGIDLPFNEFYSPIQRDKAGNQAGGSQDAFGGDISVADEMTFRRQIPGNLKSRETNLIALKQRSDVGAMERYIKDMAWFTKTAEQVIFIKNVFASEPLKRGIQEKHGESTLASIQSFIEDFGTGQTKQGLVVEKLINWVNRNFSTSVLALKGTIATKQLVSWFAMADNIPTTNFLASHVDFFKSPTSAREIVKFLWENSAALRQRGSSLDFELSKLGRQNAPLIRFKYDQTLQDIFFALIKTGDRIPIYAGGWAVYQYNIKQGKSHKQAIEAFEDSMNSTQQSTDIDKLSGLQRSGAFGRAMTMFMTARMALLRGELRAFRQRPKSLGGTGKITHREFAKRMATYHLIMPMFIQYIASGFEWDDEKMATAAILGQLNSVVIFGDLYMTAVRQMTEEDPDFFATKSPLPAVNLLKDMYGGLDEAFDALTTGGDLLEAVKELGSVTGNFTGQPVDQVINMAGGLNNVLNGDVQQGLKRLWGFSEKVAEESSD